MIARYARSLRNISSDGAEINAISNHVVCEMSGLKHFCFSPFLQNFNIYKRMFLELMNLRDRDDAQAYRTWANLRDVLHMLVSLFYTVVVVYRIMYYSLPESGSLF